MRCRRSDPVTRWRSQTESNSRQREPTRRRPTYLRMAEIHERLGDQQKAIEYYTRLVRAWKNCDPELIPIRDEAQRNLDRLLAESVREPSP